MDVTLGPTIETERLRLRPPREEDFEAWAAFLGDEEAMRHIGGMQPRAVAWRSMATFTGSWALRGFGMFSVIEKATGRWIGRLGPWCPEGWPGTEVGWGLAQAHWGKGYAAEGATAAMDWAVEALGWTDIIHTIAPANAAAVTLAERLGSVDRGPVKLPPLSSTCRSGPGVRPPRPGGRAGADAAVREQACQRVRLATMSCAPTSLNQLSNCCSIRLRGMASSRMTGSRARRGSAPRPPENATPRAPRTRSRSSSASARGAAKDTGCRTEARSGEAETRLNAAKASADMVILQCPVRPCRLQPSGARLAPEVVPLYTDLLRRQLAPTPAWPAVADASLWRAMSGSARPACAPAGLGPTSSTRPLAQSVLRTILV